MSERISEAEYWREVRETAQAVLTETREDNPEEATEELRESLDERLWETIDGHQWVIYTQKAQEILAISPNEGYAVEAFGVGTVVKDGAINWSALAFGALYADVSEVLWPLFEEAEETEKGA